MSKLFLQGMTNIVRLTSSVGDTKPWFTISIEEDKLELVTLNIIFNVPLPKREPPLL